jgi:hypothetical protein
MWNIFSIFYRDGRLIEMWKEEKNIDFFPSKKKSSTNWNVEEYQEAIMKFV